MDIISKTFIEDGITFPCINNKEYIIDAIVRAVIYLDDNEIPDDLTHKILVKLKSNDLITTKEVLKRSK